MSQREARIPETVQEDMRAAKATSSMWSVLFALYCHANPAGTCYPSITTIGLHAGLDRRTVERALKRLEDAGIIRRERRGKPGTRDTTLYTMTRGRSVPSHGEGVGAAEAGTRGSGVLQVGAAVPPRTGLEHVKNNGAPSGVPSGPSGAPHRKRSSAPCYVCAGTGKCDENDERGAYTCGVCKGTGTL